MKCWPLTRYVVPTFVLGLAMICAPIAAYGQSTEIAITTGGDFVSNGNLKAGTTWAVQGSVAHRFFQSPGLETGRLQFYAELPIAVGKGVSFGPPPPVPFQIDPGVSPEVASIFVTPGIKMKLNIRMLAPYFSAGVGAGHFYAAGRSGETRPAFSYGSGVDLNLRSHSGLRAEIRDYNSPIPKIVAGSGRQHNLFVTAGVVFRF